jgi:glycosyltransferase involved in cell wall biosynthesis
VAPNGLDRGSVDSANRLATADGTMNPTRYVVVSAHQCAPGMGSEHAVGWNLVSRMARRHALLLVTADNEFRPAVEREVKALRDEGCTIEVFFVRHGSVYESRRNHLNVGYYLTYTVYQRRVLQLVRELQRTHDIAAVHHLTINGFREPGFLWQLGIPFIWGPVGGLHFSPPELFGVLPTRGRWLQRARSAVTWAQFWLSPRVRLAYRATQQPGGAFIGATPDIADRFKRRFGGSVHWIPETGSHPPVSAVRASADDGPLRLLWVSRLIDSKPLGLLLEAIAEVPDHARRIELTVVGDGHSRARHEQTARALAINVNFVGSIPHRETTQQFDAADLFVLLSIQDLTTTVVFESLARGLPVICLDRHGYAAIVDESCGFKVPIHSLAQVRSELATRLDRLAGDKSRLLPLAQGATQRAAQFTWDRNSEKLSELLDRAVGAANAG